MTLITCSARITNYMSNRRKSRPVFEPTTLEDKKFQDCLSKTIFFNDSTL